MFSFSPDPECMKIPVPDIPRCIHYKNDTFCEDEFNHLWFDCPTPVLDVEPIVVDPKDELVTEPKMEVEEKEEMEAGNPMFMMGNLVFLGVPAIHIVGISLDLFRYKSASDYYD